MHAVIPSDDRIRAGDAGRSSLLGARQTLAFACAGRPALSECLDPLRQIIPCVPARGPEDGGRRRKFRVRKTPDRDHHRIRKRFRLHVDERPTCRAEGLVHPASRAAVAPPYPAFAFYAGDGLPGKSGAVTETGPRCPLAFQAGAGIDARRRTGNGHFQTAARTACRSPAGVFRVLRSSILLQAIVRAHRTALPAAETSRRRCAAMASTLSENTRATAGPMRPAPRPPILIMNDNSDWLGSAVTAPPTKLPSNRSGFRSL